MSRRRPRPPLRDQSARRDPAGYEAQHPRKEICGTRETHIGCLSEGKAARIGRVRSRALPSGSQRGGSSTDDGCGTERRRREGPLRWTGRPVR